MAISFDKAFGISQHTIGVRSQRAEILASNIVNADTPHYKAKDLDFAAALQSAKGRSLGGQNISRTHEQHFDLSMNNQQDVMFRMPDQPDTGDGNTVDVQVERNLYMQNALEYQTSMQFLTGSIKAIKLAIKGA